MAATAAAAVLAYAPMMGIPLIADDYPNVAQALVYGSPQGLLTLLADAQFRLRATSYWTMFALWHVGGINPWVYHLASLALHIVNAFLVFAVVRLWRPRAAAWAAIFFAVQEGHQEAVMWFSAVNELLMFAFGVGALWCWMRGKEAWSTLLLAFALLSKESAVIFLPLLALVTERASWRRLWPHALLCLLAAASIAQSHANSFRFSDGSFSLHAPFWVTWPRGLGRLLWFWGLVGCALLLLTRERRNLRDATSCGVWIGLALIPYSFLTYSTQIPSRQTYLASGGLAALVGLAISQVRNRQVAAVLVAAVLLHNAAYLWTRKRAQFLARSEPTTELLQVAKAARSSIFVRCWPLPRIVAEEAVRLSLHRTDLLLWEPSERATDFCAKEP